MVHSNIGSTTKHSVSAMCAQLAEELENARRSAFAFQPPIAGLELMRKHADALDRLLSSVLEAAIESAGGQEIRSSALDNLAIAAVGGYGRRETAPYSDIDVSFLVTDSEHVEANRVVKEAFHILMDVVPNQSGLKIGYSYRTIDDYQSLDRFTQTSLLDARHIVGNRNIVETFVSDLKSTLDAQFVLYHAKCRKVASDPYKSALYPVEPNVKTGSGALRDIHTVGWIAQALFECNAETVWRELVQRRIFGPNQASELIECWDFIASVRNALHLTASRQLDILTVERQSQIAPMLALSSEQELMERYYTCAEKVRRICGSITKALVNRRLPVDKTFFLTGGKLALADKPAVLKRPGIIIRAFRNAQECEVDISAQLEEQIRVEDRTYTDKQDYAEFRAILDGENVFGTLSEMAALGVLQRLLPEFADMLHRIPAERVHEHTIGEHSLLVLRTLEDMRSEKDTLYAGIWSSLRDQSALYLAALLHDIGKMLQEDGDHSETGAEIAADIAKRLGFSASAIETIRFLVAHHELMSNMSRHYDVNSAAVAGEFAQIVPDVNTLRNLFLLSVADAMSVGQQSYALMQRRFLEEFYFAVESRLLGPVTDETGEHAERYRKRLERTLTLANLPHEMVQEHCEVMPPAYLLNTRPERIAAHIDAVTEVRKGKPVVRLDEDLESHITELTVCTPDPGPGLLAKIAGVLYALDVTIHSASVFTRRATDKIAIDTLSIDYLQGRLPYFKRKEVEKELLRMLTGKTTAEELLSARGKSESAVPAISVQILSKYPGSHSVVEVKAEDADGLLYHITKTIARLGWNILSAKITTRGHIALDTFSIADPIKGNLPSTAASQLKQALQRIE